MPISENQLQTWSNQGALVKSKSTADSIKNALNNYDKFPTSNYEVYLQGSYKNDTNIRGESDVDVVIQLNETFFNNLNEEQKKRLGLEPAKYNYDEYYSDVLEALNNYFGSNSVKPKSKCIKIAENDNRLPADVIVSTLYRSYLKVEQDSYVEGISFFTSDTGRRIINYPKQVYDNGVAKNKSTNGMFKHMVRIFKNMRKNANAKAPSYYIQCLLYNIPSSNYVDNYFQTCINLLEYIRLISNEDLEKFVCQHEKFSLFGTSEEQWDVSSARTFNRDLITFWNAWGK